MCSPIATAIFVAGASMLHLRPAAEVFVLLGQFTITFNGINLVRELRLKLIDIWFIKILYVDTFILF